MMFVFHMVALKLSSEVNIATASWHALVITKERTEHLSFEKRSNRETVTETFFNANGSLRARLRLPCEGAE